MLRISLFGILLSCCSLSIYAQPETVFTPLISKGKLPVQFGHSFEKDYLEGKRKIDLNMSRKKRLIEDQFYIESNYGLYQLQFSGQVLYGDQLGNYVNKVLDSLLTGKPDLRKSINAYVIKSSSPNAFATPQGYIYINTGLLARLDNEAQLAFILSHEVVHYIKHHSLNKYVQTSTIKKEKVKDANQSEVIEKKLLKIHCYSQNQEFESDSAGFCLFRESNYHLKGASSSFDILAGADQPYLNLPFNANFFAINGILPQKRLNITAKEILNENQQVDERFSTHPSVNKRKEKIESLITATKKGGRLYFIHPEQTFIEMHSIAQMENLQVMLEESNYEEALYTSFAMQRENPNDRFLKKIAIKSAWFLAMALGENKLSYSQRDTSSSFGQFCNYLHAMGGEQLAGYALNLAGINTKETNEPDNLLDLKNLHSYFFSRSDYMLPDSTDAYKSELIRQLNVHDALIKKAQAIQSKEFSDVSNKVLVLGATNLIIDFRQETPRIDFLGSEKATIKTDHHIKSISQKGKRNLQLLSCYDDADRLSCDTYEDINIIKRAIGDILEFRKHCTKVDESQIDRIVEKYKTSRVCVLVSLTALQPGPGSNPLKLIAVAQLFPFGVPFLVLNTISGSPITYFRTVEIDLKSKSIYNDVSEFNQKSNIKTTITFVDETFLKKKSKSKSYMATK